MGATGSRVSPTADLLDSTTGCVRPESCVFPTPFGSEIIVRSVVGRKLRVSEMTPFEGVQRRRRGSRREPLLRRETASVRHDPRNRPFSGRSL